MFNFGKLNKNKQTMHFENINKTTAFEELEMDEIKYNKC